MAPHGRRLRADARGDRGRGRPRPAPGRRRVTALRGGLDRRRRGPARRHPARGLRQPGRVRGRRRRRRPRRPPRRSRAAGASVEEVSVPMHRDGLAIWNAIAIEGATDLMVRGDAFGTNHKGHYTTDLVDFYGRARRAARARTTRSRSSSRCCSAPTCPSATTTTTTPRRRTSGAACAAAYGEALERFDVLALPTTRDEGAADPAARRADPRRPRRGAGEPRTTRRRSTSPATRRSACPCGIVGRPAGRA